MTDLAESTPAPVTTSGSRWKSASLVRWGCAAIIAASALGRLWIISGGYYLIDDFAFLARASRPDALTWEVLSAPHQGHVMPAAHLLTWAGQALAPWNYAVPALLMAVGWLACLLLAYRVLVTLFGPTPTILLPLGFYAATPVTVQATTWWAAAINAIPLQLCALAGVLLLLPIAKGSTRLGYLRQAGVVACLLVGLAFFSKAVLLTLLFAGVALALAPGRGRAAIAAAWRAGPAMWIALVALPLAYAVAYLLRASANDETPSGSGLLSLVTYASRAIVGALLPSLAGGPVILTESADAWGTPPPWVLGLGTAALVAGIALVARASPRTRRLAVLTAVYAVACIALLSFGRQGYFAISAGALRYFSDLAVPATLLVASLAHDFLGSGPTRRQAVRWAASCIALAVFGALSIATTIRIQSNPEAVQIRGVALTALDSLRQERATTVLDLWVPPLVLTPIYGDSARASRLFARAPSAPTFADQGAALRVWSEDGRLLPAQVAGPVAQRTGACPDTPGESTRLVLGGPLVAYSHVVALTATAAAPTTVSVSVGGGPASTWLLPAGESTQYRQMVSGGTPDIVIDVPPDAAGVCVITVRVGAAAAVQNVDQAQPGEALPEEEVTAP